MIFRTFRDVISVMEPLQGAIEGLSLMGAHPCVGAREPFLALASLALPVEEAEERGALAPVDHMDAEGEELAVHGGAGQDSSLPVPLWGNATKSILICPQMGLWWRSQQAHWTYSPLPPTPFDFAQNFARHPQKVASKTAPNPKCMSVAKQKRTAENSRSSRRFSRATKIAWPLFQVHRLTRLG